MNITLKYSKNIIYNTLLIFRYLEEGNPPHKNTTNAEDIQKQQLRDLYIYVAVLLSIILSIIGGYALYRKCVEKKVIEEFEREYQLMLMNLMNSYSSSNNSSPGERRPHSYNNINRINIPNISNDLGSHNSNNSIEFIHEERMEKMRKKYGNSIIIKCLLKKQIEEVIFDKNISRELGDVCTICMDNFNEKLLINKTPCEHIFHKNCFDTYLKGIKKKDKLVCPNCNQNLLINKKFLKLRAKPTKIEIKRKLTKKKENKEIMSENDFNDSNANKESIVTNKNEEVFNNNNEVIFVRKKYRKKNLNENKKSNLIEKNSHNVYNPIQLNVKKKDSITKVNRNVLSYNDKNGKEMKENKKEDREVICIENNFDRRNNGLFTPFKNTINVIEHKNRVMHNKKKRLRMNEVNSERDVINMTKKTSGPMISTTKQEN
jgi:hypothetical protein